MSEVLNIFGLNEYLNLPIYSVPGKNLSASDCTSSVMISGHLICMKTILSIRLSLLQLETKKKKKN